MTTMTPQSRFRGGEISLRIYRRLLRAYPKAYRDEYGPAMVQLFRDQCQDACQEAGHWGLAGLWGRTIRDLAVTSTVERWEEMQRRKPAMEQTFFNMPITFGRAIYALSAAFLAFGVVLARNRGNAEGNRKHGIGQGHPF